MNDLRAQNALQSAFLERQANLKNYVERVTAEDAEKAALARQAVPMPDGEARRVPGCAHIDEPIPELEVATGRTFCAVPRCGNLLAPAPEAVAP